MQDMYNPEATLAGKQLGGQPIAQVLQGHDLRMCAKIHFYYELRIAVAVQCTADIRLCVCLCGCSPRCGRIGKLTLRLRSSSIVWERARYLTDAP